MIAIVQAPSVQVGRVEYDAWWKNLLLRAKVGDIHLLLPGLDTSAFLAPLGGKPSHQLHIGAYRINKTRVDRFLSSERLEPLSEAVDARLRRVDDNQIILCVGYPEPDKKIPNKIGEELVLVVAIQSPNSSGLPQQKNHYIRFDPRGSGAFPSVDRATSLPPLLLPVEPLMLELVAHV